jgi:hypothetical protein
MWAATCLRSCVIFTRNPESLHSLLSDYVVPRHFAPEAVAKRHKWTDGLARPEITAQADGQQVSVTTSPNANGVLAVSVPVPANGRTFAQISLQAGGLPVREPTLVIWTVAPVSRPMLP